MSRGAYTGGPLPFGFTWNEDEQRWTPDVNYPVLQQMRVLRERGKGYRAIAAEMNAQGFPTPKGATEWRAPTVRNILRNKHAAAI